ncbi:MAG: glycosyltransferase [Leptolyngbyaceae cyanobacterium bins.59]|nr:glycosyltransferase [Leptolyngbyaceae cyanobacterium bins.59]
MKVLHVIPSLSPSLGGPTQVALNLVRALCEGGVDAEIVTTNDDGPQLLDVPLGERVIYQEAPVWFLPRFSPPLKEFIFSPAITAWLWQQVHKYDILDNHYLFSYAPTCAGAIARFQGVPYTVRTMGQLSPWALAQSRQKKQVYLKLIERHNLERAAAIHCTSGGEAQDVRNFGVKTPLVTLPLGVQPPMPYPNARQELRASYGITAETPIVLFLSRLHYKKRPDVLLEALVKVREQGYSFHAILAGSGTPEYELYLRDLVESLQLGDRISLPGLITGQAKEILLQGSDFFVLPSFSENFGIAVAEAMAARLPVVITPGVQIAPEIAEAEAGLVVESEVEPLTEAIVQLLQSPPLRQRLGQNGRALVDRRYSWNVIATQLTSAYKALLMRS